MLKIDIRPGEWLQIGDTIVKVVRKSGQIVSLAIDAPRSVPIKRQDANESTLPPRKSHISSP